MQEFEYIKNYIYKLDDDSLIGDDAATINCTQNKLLVTKDILIEGVHFLKQCNPNILAKKALRSNLSDIAAMGAIPYGYCLGLVLPNNISQDWWKNFTDSLREEHEKFCIKLLGGDTTSHKQDEIIVSITAFGTSNGNILKRSGAKIGDFIYVSGNIGDAALGLLVYKKIINKNYYKLKNKYDIPQPRINLGISINKIASSCIDISDGLIQDIEHICNSSQVGASIYLDKIPLSNEAKEIINNTPQYINYILSGGDDYELVFTINPKFSHLIQDISCKNKVKISKIGEITLGNCVTLYDNNRNIITPTNKGFNHFM
ncbi:thiamine-monophosphate kinase [Ehrlichia chaffeensis str. Heartland]|uniref:thiamine-phosphate kinase n=1 Tax=Ehrlichia chaffeensis TaxID=945 RepID=UPI000444CF97|nr:thiamine-phosphate kinase [Ehrlichia chaffeensis]AHX03623.1 thiamine-monophosphate kinase [Ehrlichia chaffeensis str. Heartland]AHX05656.1 thiamine-monophosphate kinase [Ehrlichia chaffeensis str. Jax]AHX06647.1 thiamine-monophosphate kinase [Ehrlichia chaffeensis str. Liberty]AHX07626.1 thiamine-monophosphate kinase [Ehrlichia chaffeensis str. Osceola]AHX08340.1 thiamine-monophosphate kinase [Ehrlichia chaffeensis str. Saint Vincent]